jgi:hypothetical protein
MKTEIREDSANYPASIIKLPPKQAVPGLDNLVQVSVFQNDCLVSKDSREDLKYIFFPAGAQLSHEFASHNNLYRDNQLNVDTTKKGFFDANRRVKAIKLKGITSTGFVIPITALDYLGKTPNLEVGAEFTSLDGVEICRKYVVPGNTQGTPGSKDKTGREFHSDLEAYLVRNQFRFHSETGHLAKSLHMLSLDDIMVITDKWHGSSCILSKVYIRRKLNLWQKLINKLGGEIVPVKFGYIYSSGKPKNKVIKGIDGVYEHKGQSFYASDIWRRAMDDYKETLEDGISLYGELVGFQDTGGAIQKGYNYGCHPTGLKGTVQYNIGGTEHQVATPGQYRFVVYRITYTKPDGNVIEFTWSQIKEYCKKYNLEHVPELYFGKLRDWVDQYVWSWKAPLDQMPEGELMELIAGTLAKSYNLEKTCEHCDTGVPAEGIVVRMDSRPNFAAYKLKAKAFTKKESDDMDKGEVDIESIQ